ncbi:Di-heme cytochrome, transmembrane [Candidatus Sulfotelmatomonas gaucii]|uniref:Di-heme cytochrome, transmembrane n=1 Tax=Candidatus Sulfuritelmatomonas gaucii TaxID=2043161 RepID=A0A2N9L6S8_9BACT|nr:Di-heme cytochrome, transmembrane [Candidatus Sulfotelmatomonas gaucii]
MRLFEWATSPWGQSVPIHIAWGLMWVAVIAGLFFMIVHSLYLIVVRPPKRFAQRKAEASTAAVPERVPRHTLTARLFHWIMAASMLTLLITAFLPKVGVQFNWVLYHWIAGVVLTVSILFHIVHSTFFLDFWSIWPDKTDLRDAMNRTRRFFGKDAPSPSKFAKYPLENKLYHGAVMLAGLAVIVTGLFMMKRVQTGIFTRNPYLFSDMTWGLMYVLHGLAGVGFIALTIMHIYMGVRPEKFPITKSMIFGWMSRDFYLEEHDTGRWAVKGSSSSKRGLAASDGD